MRDVADEAGVSFKTVSRVVNGEYGVSAGTVSRVQDAIRVLGYRPDHRARHLRQDTTRTGAIGFVLVDVANPFFSSTLRGIEDVARTTDYLVLAGSTDGDADRERQLIDAFVDRRVDGLIVVPSAHAATSLRAEIDRHTPIVFLDLAIDGVEGEVDLVRSDHRGGARVATEHLLAHGHTDIACFSDDKSVFSAHERVTGFCEAMTAAGLTVAGDRIVTGRHTPEVWHATVHEYLRRPDPPTAIFTAQNYVTEGATRALHQLDLHRTIAQVGFDDLELADLVEPGITVMPQHPRDLGRRAAELLFDRLAGHSDRATTVILSNELVERGSGEIAPHG